MLAELVLESSKKYGDKKAIKSGDEFLTYKELIEKALNISTKLRKYALNMRLDNPSCGLVFQQSVTGIISILACVLAKITYVPLDLLYPKDRLIYMTTHAKVNVLITDVNGLDVTKELIKEMDDKPRIILIDELLNKNNEEVSEECFSSDINPYVYLLYTSGSSGLPKAVVQKDNAIIHFANEYIDNLNITCDDNLTLFSSYGHDASVIDIFSSLLSGACLCQNNLQTSENLFKLPYWLKKNNITVWHSVPSLFRSLWKSYRRAVDLPDLRLIVLGGEAVRSDDFILCKEKFKNLDLYNLYGQTESSYSCGKFIYTANDISQVGHAVKDTQLIMACENNKLKVIESGRLNNSKSYCISGNTIVDKGELLISSPFIAEGYWLDDKLTANAFFQSLTLEKIYRTGDFVDVREDGTVIFTGRRDNQIKIRGYRVEIGEIESKILLIDGIDECIVVSSEINDDINLVAFVKAYREITLVEINSFLKKVLPSYMLIFEVINIKKLPLTVTGKVDRKALKSQLCE